MKKLNVLSGVLFGLTGLVSLVFSHDWLQAGAWLALGGGLAISDLHYQPAGAPAGSTTVSLSPARKYLSMALVLVSILLFGFMVGRDFKARQHRETNTHNAR